MFPIDSNSLAPALYSPPDRFQPRRQTSAEISHLRGRYYSAQVSAQAQVHSLFFFSHNLMGRQSDTTGERSGAGPTTLLAFRDTELGLKAAHAMRMPDTTGLHAGVATSHAISPSMPRERDRLGDDTKLLRAHRHTLP